MTVLELDDELLPFGLDTYWIALYKLPPIRGMLFILCRDSNGRQWTRCALYDGTRESLGENAVAYASTAPKLVYRSAQGDTI